MHWTRELRSTLVVVLGSAAAICGLIVDAPEVVSRAIEKGPEFLSNPDVWWIAGILLACGAILMRIWRRPVANHHYKDILNMFASSPPHLKRLAKLWAFLGSFQDAVFSCKPQDLNAKYVFNRLELVYPQQIRAALGPDAERQFLRAVAASKSAGPRIACEAAIMPAIEWIEAAIDAELSKPEKAEPLPVTASAAGPPQL